MQRSGKRHGRRLGVGSDLGVSLFRSVWFRTRALELRCLGPGLRLMRGLEELLGVQQRRAMDSFSEIQQSDKGSDHRRLPASRSPP